MKKCPQCQKLNSNQNATCEYCNTDLGEPTITPPPIAAPETSAPAVMKKTLFGTVAVCPHCNAVNTAQSTHCWQCKKSLTITPEAVPATSTPTKKVVAKTCPQCGTTNYKAATMYCYSCGASLKGVEGREPPPLAAPTSSIAAPTQQIDALAVTLPLGEKWQPVQAQQLMTTLFNLTPVTLEIAATNNAINWHILPDPRNKEAVTRAILSLYPHADLAPVQQPKQQYQAYRHIRARAEFFSPLASADGLKTIDPLTNIIGAMSHLQQGEQVVYQLKLKPPDANYHQIGDKKIHKQTSWWEVLGCLTLGIISFIAAAADMDDQGRPRQKNTKTVHHHYGDDSKDNNKFEPQFQRLYEEKLQHALTPADFTIFVKGSTAERTQSILAGILSATSVFNKEFGNTLSVGDKAFPLVLTPDEAAALWHLPTADIQTQEVVRASSIAAALPRELAAQPDHADTIRHGETLIGYNTFQGETRPVYIQDPDRITHVNIVGKTRVGKTTLLHNMIHSDIQQGKGVGVIDPHGDLIKDILAKSIPPEREKDVILFDLADLSHLVSLNLLHVPSRVEKHAAVSLTLGVLKKLFADQWSATRMEDALYSALAALVETNNTTIRDIPRLFHNAEYRTDILNNVHDDVVLEFWQEEYDVMSEGYKREVSRPIIHRIRAFYRNPTIKAIVTQPASLDFRSLMDEGKIFLASLAGEGTQSESATIGALLISKIQMAAMSRAHLPPEQRKMFYLYVDEVQNFITTSLSNLFSEAAKYAVSLTVANQFLRQLEGGTLEAIIGNTGTTIMFACGAQDAADLGRYVKPVFDQETLMNLSRFNAIVKMQHAGETLPAFNIKTPPPPEPVRSNPYTPPPYEIAPDAPQPAAPSVQQLPEEPVITPDGAEPEQDPNGDWRDDGIKWE